MTGNEFNSLERELREALRRSEPSADFAQRVMAAARREDDRRARRWAWLSAWTRPFSHVPRLAWVAAVVVALLAGVAAEREHRRRIEGERAKEQLMLALRVTGTKLHTVHRKVRAVTIDTGAAIPQ